METVYTAVVLAFGDSVKRLFGALDFHSLVSEVTDAVLRERYEAQGQ